jgi:hypothetical protein
MSRCVRARRRGVRARARRASWPRHDILILNACVSPCLCGASFGGVQDEVYGKYAKELENHMVSPTLCECSECTRWFIFVTTGMQWITHALVCPRTRALQNLHCAH